MIGYFYSLEQKNVAYQSGIAFIIGLCVGLAFSFRFQAGLFGVSFALLYVLEGRWKAFLFFVGGSLICLGLYGLYDVSMGRPFLGSALGYFEFNIMQSGASQWGVQPWHRYITSLNRFFTLPLALWILIGALLSLHPAIFSKSKKLWLIILPFWLVHNLIGHKEDRFIFPVLPWIVVLAVYGWSYWIRNRKLKTKVMLSAAYFLVMTVSVIYGYAHSSWKHHGFFTTEMAKLSKKKQLESLAVFGTLHSGSYFYLHQNIPLFHFSDLNHAKKERFKEKVGREFKSVIALNHSGKIPESLLPENIQCVLDAKMKRLYHCELSK